MFLKDVIKTEFYLGILLDLSINFQRSSLGNKTFVLCPLSRYNSLHVDSSVPLEIISISLGQINRFVFYLYA